MGSRRNIDSNTRLLIVVYYLDSQSACCRQLEGSTLAHLVVPIEYFVLDGGIAVVLIFSSSTTSQMCFKNSHTCTSGRQLAARCVEIICNCAFSSKLPICRL
jgi:hypothetical protein